MPLLNNFDSILSGCDNITHAIGEGMLTIKRKFLQQESFSDDGQ